MIHSLTIQCTLTYQVKIEAESREEAERLARQLVIARTIPLATEDWEYIHVNGTRHFVPEGKK